MSDWSLVEVELIIADYFKMLQTEISGIDYSKTDQRNELQTLLRNRSKGSIEFKHQNISAVLINNGLPYIKGYKPRWNYQQLLEESIIDYLSQNSAIEEKFNDFAIRKIENEPKKVEYKNWNVTPPETALFREPTVSYYRPIKRNYLELEQKNRSIGDTGEKLVLEYEKWRLINAGLPKLANEVRWVSKDIGDGAGFDILSKNAEGSDIFIEVKSTTLGKETPIFFSKRESDFSEQKKEDYHIYRVFDLRNQPKMFKRNGRFKDICTIEAISFKGFF